MHSDFVLLYIQKVIMFKYFLIIFIFLIAMPTFAFDENQLQKEWNIQTKIDDIGAKLLNANKIDKRIVFAYNKEEKKSLLKIDPAITKRQVVLYEGSLTYIENDDELAAYLARGILHAIKSYHGAFDGYLGSFQVKAAPKKFELVADKRAVDFMAHAGYNPVGLITFIQKSCPQKRFDRFSTKNLTSKRLAHIYEYIYTKYPYYLVNNPYKENEHYQNFLLTSLNNRRMLAQKIKNGSKEELDYE